MIGNPKFNYGDKVSFILNNEEKTGTIFTVDAFGTFEDNSDVSYDILNKKDNIIYKHIKEPGIKKIN